MRIAILSDIHGNIAALDAIVADFARRQVSDVLNLGDCLSGPLDAVGTAERLIKLGWPTVRGNHDRLLYDRPRDQMGRWETWVIDDLAPEHLDWVRSFPGSLQVGEIFACHGTPERDDENWLDHRGPQNRLVARDLDGVRDRLAGVEAPVVVCGHTHAPRFVRVPDGPMIVNPGSAGCPAYHDARTEPAFVQQTGAPDARYALLEKSPVGWQAMMINVPYDAGPMIELAKAKGATGWVRALTAGWTA
jgi:putative phosphoesterase